MSYLSEKLRHFVKERANACCEYCLFPEKYLLNLLEIDHIYAKKHGGSDQESNLSASCYECNRHKGTDLASIDEMTGNIIPLFHPRNQNWYDHFRLNGAWIEPLTPEGRVTVRLLQLNKDIHIVRRTRLIKLGRYPVK